MNGLWFKIESFLLKIRDKHAEFISSSEPGRNPYSHKDEWCATLAFGGKHYSVTLTEID